MICNVAAVNITDRIFSDVKLENEICDDGENIIFDKDCELSPNSLNDMWLIRALILVTLILFFTKKEYLPIAIICLVVLVAYNDGFGQTEVIEETPVNNTNCYGMVFFENAGSCLTPTRPIIGWVIVGAILLFLLWWMFR